MTASPADPFAEVYLVLREIVAEHGQSALSNPARMSNLLTDLLPEAPGLARILVAAAEDRVADDLRDHASSGLDAATAARLVASAFARRSLFAPEACAAVVGGVALALGLAAEPGHVPTVISGPPGPAVAADCGGGQNRPPADPPAQTSGAGADPPGSAQARTGDGRLPRPLPDRQMAKRPDPAAQSHMAPTAPRPDEEPVPRMAPRRDSEVDETDAAPHVTDRNGLTAERNVPRAVQTAGTLPSKPTRSAVRGIFIAVGLAVIVVIVLLVVPGYARSSQKVLISLTGTGSSESIYASQSKLFRIDTPTVAVHYRWSDCPFNANLLISLRTPQGYYLPIANTADRRGARTVTVRPPRGRRKYYLQIVSKCDWLVVVKTN